MTTEVINLRSGWNAVWINVDPEPSNLDSILASQSPLLDYQSIWTFDPGGPGVSATADPGRWFFRDRNVPVAISSLKALQGNRAYLIKMDAPGRLTLMGRTIIRSQQYLGRIGNLVGTLTNPKSPVPLSFEHYFSHPNAQGKIRLSGAPLREEIFRLTNDSFVRIPIGSAFEANVACWVNAAQDFEYRGPIDVKATVNGFDFGRTTSRKTVVVEVPSAEDSRSLSVQALPCAALGSDPCVPLPGGADWLEYRDPALEGKAAWQPLTKGTTFSLAKGQSQIALDIRARRRSLTRGAKGGEAVEEFPAFVEFQDDRGARTVLSANVAVQPIFGSWVGRVALDKVGTHPAVQSLPLEEADAAPFNMTLILDLPSSSRRSAGAGPRLLDFLAFASHRDGRPLMQRFHSVLFDRPVALIEDGGDPLDPLGAGGTLRAEIHIGREDALNPYRHRYNPEHRVGYEVTRAITLKIESQTDSLADELAGLDGTFGPNLLTGMYTEVITGVSRDPITVQGSFRLNRLVAEEGGRP